MNDIRCRDCNSPMSIDATYCMMCRLRQPAPIPDHDEIVGEPIKAQRKTDQQPLKVNHRPGDTFFTGAACALAAFKITGLSFGWLVFFALFAGWAINEAERRRNRPSL